MKNLRTGEPTQEAFLQGVRDGNFGLVKEILLDGNENVSLMVGSQTGVYHIMQDVIHNIVLACTDDYQDDKENSLDAKSILKKAIEKNCQVIELLKQYEAKDAYLFGMSGEEKKSHIMENRSVLFSSFVEAIQGMKDFFVSNNDFSPAEKKEMIGRVEGLQFTYEQAGLSLITPPTVVRSLGQKTQVGNIANSSHVL